MFKEVNMLRPFLESNRELNVREHARLQRCTPATSSKYLREFCEQGVLSCRHERNLLLYAPAESEAFRTIKKNWNVELIQESGLVQGLVHELREPLVIMLFGSYAKGENTSESDIDVFVLTRTQRQVELVRFEKKLRARIHLFVCTPSEVVKLRKKNPHLLNNVVNGVRLHGFWEIF